MAAPTFRTVVHRADGSIEVYNQTGDTPQSLAIIEERLRQFPEGSEHLYQHGDGSLRDSPEILVGEKRGML